MFDLSYILTYKVLIYYVGRKNDSAMFVPDSLDNLYIMSTKYSKQFLYNMNNYYVPRSFKWKRY